MLENNGINAYTVLMDGALSLNGNPDYFAHAATAIPVGEARYPDSSIYPAMVLIEFQMGDIW